MPTFHFNIRCGDAVVRDTDGVPLPDIESARDVARGRARNLHLMTEGSDRAIEITDTIGRVIDSVVIRGTS